MQSVLLPVKCFGPPSLIDWLLAGDCGILIEVGTYGAVQSARHENGPI